MRPVDLRVEHLTNPLGIDVAQPRLSWRYDLADQTRRGQRQSAYRILVATSQTDLDQDTGDLWDSGRQKTDSSTHIAYAGQALESHQWCYWKVIVWDETGAPYTSGESACWQMGLLRPEDWQAAWIGAEHEPTRVIQVLDAARNERIEVQQSPPCPLLRRCFRTRAPVRRAVLYATALGEYEVRLNGQRVGDRYLTPEWTDYDRRVLYQAYEVTDLLQPGDHALGAQLADGWYLGLLGPGDRLRQRYYGSVRRFRCQLHLEFADGTTDTVGTDSAWKLCPDGPIRSSDHFLGETVDFRRERSGWDCPDYDDSDWQPVYVDEAIDVPVTAQRHEPIQVFASLEPVSVTEPEPGVFIFDMGQNLAGWCEIELDGPAGTEVRLRHGEMLELDGTLHTENLRLARQTDTYILDGRGSRTAHPRFTFHGFQYVEVTGLPQAPPAGCLVARAFSNNPPVTGSFHCSNPHLEQLWRNILWTQRGNMHAIPTDCPQRNERMGWTGDAQVFARTALFNMDMAAFFAKYTTDMRDAQGASGAFTDFAPHPFRSEHEFSFGPGWADAGIIVPWHTYVASGDIRLLAEHYDAMRRYVDGIRARNPDGVWRDWGSNYGDWLNGDTLIAEDYPATGASIPKQVFATAFFALSASLLARIATVLRQPGDVARYTDLAAQVRTAFEREFVAADGTIEGDTQSTYAIALGFDLLPPSLQPAAVARLIDRIEAYDRRLSTGFISTIHMIRELSRRGHHELACELVESHRFPSWLYTIDQGATTVWERWDGYVKGRGFQNKGMNSFNHYSIGAVGEWLYTVVLGLEFDPAAPGMKHAIIRPRPGGSLTWARGSYRSQHGLFAVAWTRQAGTFTLEVDVPPNTSASVSVPTTEPDAVREGGEVLSDRPGIESVTVDTQEVTVEVLSGSYRFSAPSTA